MYKYMYLCISLHQLQDLAECLSSLNIFHFFIVHIIFGEKKT